MYKFIQFLLRLLKLKGRPWFTVAFTLAVILALTLSACGTQNGGIPNSPQQVVDEVNKGVALYQNAQRGASSFRLTVDTEMGKMRLAVSLVQAYNAADIAKVEAWTRALDNSSARLFEILANYKDANGNPIPVDKLDLAALAQAGALPDSIGGGFSLYLNAFTEAQKLPVDPSVTLAAMRTGNEGFNHINASGDDWNSDVQAYNTWRNQVSGDIVATVAQKLGIKDLPRELPYYSGDYGGSVSNPDFVATPAK